MKVLLIQSYLSGRELPVFPLGLACISSVLVDHDVRIFDTNTSQRPFQKLEELIKDFLPDITAISIRNIDSTNKRKVVFYYSFLKYLIDVIKKVSSNAKIIAGGPGFSMFAREIMEDEMRIDFGVFLEGELIFPRLLQNINTPENVKSVFFRKKGKVLFTGTGEPVDLNSVVFPNRQSIPLNDYKKFPDAIGIETKRGCALHCIYCIYGFLNGRHYRMKDPKKVVDEIETLVQEQHVERFTFVDSVFNIPLKYAGEICNELIDRGIKVKWSAWFNEKGLTRDFTELVRKAGCVNIILSPDGFSDEVLKNLGKNLTKQDILISYKMLSNIDDIEISYNFFKNPPGQDFRTFISLIFFLIRAKMQMGKRVHFEFNSMRIEPHTKLHKIAIEEGIIAKGESLLYPKYYTNQKTWYIEKLFNLILIFKEKIRSCAGNSC